MEPTNGAHQPEEQIAVPATEPMQVAPALLDSIQADPIMTEPVDVAKPAVNGTAITRTPAPARTGQPVIDVSDLRKTYTMGEMEVHALRGEIAEFTGVSSPYEEPVNADLVVETDVRSAEEIVEGIWEELLRRGIIAS